MEEAIRQVGAQLYQALVAQRPKLAQTHRLENELLRWCLQDPHLRTQTLRFIDCLPALHSDAQIIRHLKEYFPSRSMRLPLPLRLGLGIASSNLATAGVVAKATRYTVSRVSHLFLAGSTRQEAFATIEHLEKQGFSASVDLLGEATASESEADRYAHNYLELLRQWKAHLSSLPNVSLKFSSLAFPFDPVDPEGTWARLRPRITQILEEAIKTNGFVNVDMEQHALRDLTLALTQRLLEEFPKECRIGVVIQAYLKDSRKITEQLIQWAKGRGVPITIRLVRGAYWDSEVITSRQRNWPCPVYTTKQETDASFEQLTDILFENHQHLRIAIATHNLRSIARAIVKARELHVPQDHWEAQVLFGMGEAIQGAVRELGIPVRIYAPVGELIPGMSYLVRRILENTSHTSFLAMSLMEHRPLETLLEPPHGV